jgi:hypothetical protein
MSATSMPPPLPLRLLKPLLEEVNFHTLGKTSISNSLVVALASSVEVTIQFSILNLFTDPAHLIAVDLRQRNAKEKPKQIIWFLSKPIKDNI